LSKGFVEHALDRARRLDSRIVLAFDPATNPYKFKDLEKKSNERDAAKNKIHSLLSKLEGRVPGVKLGLPALLSLGPDEIEKITAQFNKNYFFICDSKMADIGHINRIVADQIFDLGFDALIVHAFIGGRDGVDEVVKLALEKDRGVLAVCSMTHAGANEYLNKHLDALLELAASTKVDGFILPAVIPKMIRRAREKYHAAMIVSPGAGAQGAPFGSALAAGADFEIIGRALIEAPSPAKKAQEIIEAMKHEPK
jgi:orotidine-5'-phosphate decarboxylase